VQCSKFFGFAPKTPFSQFPPVRRSPWSGGPWSRGLSGSAWSTDKSLPAIEGVCRAIHSEDINLKMKTEDQNRMKVFASPKTSFSLPLFAPRHSAFFAFSAVKFFSPFLSAKSVKSPVKFLLGCKRLRS